MCQPKSEGGKRCLKHAKLSQFSTRVVKLKTEADDATISSTMRELSREGKNLPDVSPAEALNFIEVKRFATQFDPELDAHERKIQLNQLEKAADEVKDGVSGGHMHAWKNLLTRVGKKVKKAFIPLALTGAVMFGAAGCAQPSDHHTVAPTGTSTSQPVTSGTAYGDSIVIGKVTDALGTYENTGINPKDAIMTKVDPSIVAPSVAANGFTPADTLSAQQYVATFIASQGLDSNAVDLPESTGWNVWEKNEASKYIYAPLKSELLTPTATDKSDRSIIINNNQNGVYPPLVRDGKPRLSNTTIGANAISGGSDPKAGKYLYLEGTAIADYRVSQKNSIAWLLKNNPKYTEATLKAARPDLFANSEDDFQTTLTWKYAVVKDGASWKIAGFDNTWEYTMQANK
jgi:hypothetical protein